MRGAVWLALLVALCLGLAGCGESRQEDPEQIKQKFQDRLKGKGMRPPPNLPK